MGKKIDKEMEEGGIQYDLKQIHSNKFNILFHLYGGFRRVFKSKIFKLSIFISVLLIGLCSFITILSGPFLFYPLLNLVIDLGISIFPSILGLTFAGYAIIISAGDKDMVSSMVNNKVKDGKLKGSTYQKIISVFAWVILVQSFTLCCLVSLKILIICLTGFYFFYHAFFSELINLVFLFFGCLLVFYSLFLIPQVVLNVYQYGQMINFFIYNRAKEKSKDKNM
ncbi:hypothetical protein [Litoribacter populi]|uniref:hypothetical protein n=1 Tax=Litoribacter populi TaxID=2598460 RepID=UPI00117F5EA2|nr:hypothetical protein [Litoribacter populi]